jgi:DNA-binding response OmpR family regulator
MSRENFKGTREHMTPKKILIIDDDLFLQSMLNIALTNAGYQVEMADDGIEGLEKLARIQPDLLISDIMMPNMDGVEMFRQIKERLQDSGIPIIIMTALGRKPWFNELEADGAVIIQKPFKIDLLIDLVNMNIL